MPSSPRFFFRIVLISLLAVFSWTVCSATDQAPALPADLMKLLPSELECLVVVQSLNDLDDQWADMMQMFGDEDPRSLNPLHGFLNEIALDFSERIDRNRPLALAMVMPPIMMSQEPLVSVIVPLANRNLDLDELGLTDQTPTIKQEGRYLLLSQDPEFFTGLEPPDLALNRPEGLVSIGLNLESLISNLRPVVEMGMLSLTMTPAAMPDSTGTMVETEPFFSQTEATAMANLANALMDSAKRLDLAFRISDGKLTVCKRFEVFPGSPLEIGPQPDFDTALELTRLLPPGEDLLEVLAVDQTTIWDVFQDFYVLNMERQMKTMPDEDAVKYAEWIDTCMSSMDLFFQPMAVTMKVEPEGLRFHFVMQADDSKIAADRYVEVLLGSSSLDLGVDWRQLETSELEGVQITNFEMSVDPDKLDLMAQTMPSNPAQMPGLGTPTDIDAEHFSAMIRKLCPHLSLCSVGDYLIICADHQADRLEYMIKAAKKPRGKVDPQTAELARAAGPGCQFAFHGDLLAILNLITELFEEFSEKEYETLQDTPIPLSGVYTIDGPVYGFEMNLEMIGIQRLIEIFQE